MVFDVFHKVVELHFVLFVGAQVGFVRSRFTVGLAVVLQTAVFKAWLVVNSEENRQVPRVLSLLELSLVLLDDVWINAHVAHPVDGVVARKGSVLCHVVQVYIKI